MNNNFYAVILGFNSYDDSEHFKQLKYAEKDAQDIYDVLTDPGTIDIPRENVTLINSSKSLTEIETTIFKVLVKDRKKDDTVLLYYSGHGFYASLFRRAYLAVPTVKCEDIENDPKNGLSMKWLHDDIFYESPAKYTLFFLDCCNSGSFCPAGKQTEVMKNSEYKSLIEKNSYSGGGRSAFVSSPADVNSRESDVFKNGVFTHFLLDGLKGKARNKENNEITLSSLWAYVDPQMPPDQPCVLEGESTRIVLSPSTRHLSENSFGVNNCRILIEPTDSQSFIQSLPNPLDDYISLLERIIENIDDNYQNDDTCNQILNSVNSFLNSDLVFVEEVNDNYTKPKFASTLIGKKKDFNKYRNQIIPLFTDELLSSREKLLETRFGVYKPLSKSTNKYCICIPLIDENPRLFLFIVGVTFEQLKYGQILGRILISLYTATNGFKESSKTKIENLMLDDLRRWFGYVPSKIYNRRKETFLNKLQTIMYYFQPIVQISNKDPQIYSWEALARDPSSNKDSQKLKAPFDLFTTAELWGPSFLRELDLYCLKTSVGEFVNFWKRDRRNEKICEPLSINVYSDTLFNKEYKEELNRMVNEEVIINSNYLVLEISERRASPRDPNIDEKEYQNLFLEELSNYARDYNTSFAIDDFGVGFSSVDRLAKLKLKHIKIDKDVLRYEYPLITIKYVLEMVKCFNPSPAKVVIEGYDNDKEINISLRDLYKNKIMYLQGHIVRKAEPSLTSLRESEKTRIKEELSERKKTEDIDE